MNDPKLQLTPVQLGLTLLNGAGLIFCAGGDVFLLMFDRGTVRHSAVIMNLALAVIVAVMCGVLVVKAGDIDLFDKGELRDKKPAVSALRTFFCMVTLDITIVLIMMLAGTMFWQGAGRAISFTAPLMFLMAGIVYYFQTKDMGDTEVTEETDAEADEKKAALMKAAEDIIAEEHRPRTAEDILAQAKADISLDEADTPADAEVDRENENEYIQDD
ncbi:hypothetical protein RASY3_10325 [Ruminococcus albus SY3]|uniref:Uncharacterized protein n=1 Tax=Ruminococcus albus SY3 TaxID=1341156 RepID=A0A011W0J6_RUMAL|nr:hypothetical protein [Ruminococcus albus]EXM40333.1 hypothetical protein RASY3_10325 [Ruminococcus albus SY3]